jgi:tetratricopeptide (TPR) repeat protein
MKRIWSRWGVTCTVASILALGSWAGAQDAQPKPSLTKKVASSVRSAQKALEKEKWAECVADLRKAEAVEDKGPYDVFAINELLGFCAARLDDLATTARAYEVALDSGFLDPSLVNLRHKQLMQVNYNLKDYAKAAAFGKKAVELGERDENTYTLAAQAYYLLEDFASTRDFVQGWIADLESQNASPPEIGVQLYLSSCIKLQDDACALQALEKQATYHPRAETWPNLILLVFRQADESQTIDVLRLAFDRDGMRRAEEYTEMAQLALERGLPGEAQAVLEAGVAKSLFSEPRAKELSDRLLATATSQAKTDRVEVEKQAEQAAAGTNGQVDVRIGQAFLSYGEPGKAIEAIERGIAKGNLRNVPDAQLSLGIAQLRSGNKEAAIQAFDAVKGNATLELLARLWKIAAR